MSTDTKLPVLGALTLALIGNDGHGEALVGDRASGNRPGRSGQFTTVTVPVMPA